MIYKVSFVSAQRAVKSFLALAIGCFGLIVAIDNIVDFQSNYTFVKHVLSMDSMQPFFHGTHLLSRAITNTTLQLLCYYFIIFGELLFGLLSFISGLLMLFKINAEQTIFNQSKVLFIIGVFVGLLIWYFGFCVIGGEYFSMWANQWNGQDKAYTFVTFLLIALLYITRPEKHD
ncbi:DUF2165 family protein [Piscirickettsia litoralis]|uniref:DUF2165 domain-containing protein n=1 Tax=Piscirickettsia litoralis TaxID=1891921 RepID=A0ABX3A213_9GAMM|nr:DUF2165 domain-containing protein [Piscirickettsia litoralis]ODN42868.1 hypothetical protein BGC07_07950 [Piscirickettsia litoralis]